MDEKTLNNKDIAIQEKLAKIDKLREMLQLKSWSHDQLVHPLELEYTYESNRIEGNTLTLQETVLVIEKGITIAGKPLKDHLEAINHGYAIDFIKEIVQKKIPLTPFVLRDIHRLVLQSIDNENAGTYRKVNVLISGSKHIPSEHYIVPKQMDDFFIWYNESKQHPVLFAAQAHERLVTIHPFIDGNGRTARLLMNLILLQKDYPILILKGDSESRLTYYNTLETAQITNEKMPFFEFILDNMQSMLERILGIVK